MKNSQIVLASQVVKIVDTAGGSPVTDAEALQTAKKWAAAFDLAKHGGDAAALSGKLLEMLMSKDGAK